MTPDFYPLGIQISIERFSKGVGCRVVTALFKECLSNPEKGQRTSLVQLDSFLVLANGVGWFA